MPRQIRDLRTTDLSLQEYIASSFSTEDYIILSGHDEAYVTSGIYVIDGFPVDTGRLIPPTISIEHFYSSESPLQLGTGKTDERDFLIDVFARSDGERDDLAEAISYFLRNDVPIFNYNEVLTGGDYNEIGRGRVERKVITSDRLDPGNVKLRHTMQVYFSLHIDVSSGYSLIN